MPALHLSTVLKDVLVRALMRRRTTSTGCVGAKKSSQSHTIRTRAQFSRCHSSRLAADWCGQPVSRVPGVRYPHMSVRCPLWS